MKRVVRLMLYTCLVTLVVAAMPLEALAQYEAEDKKPVVDPFKVLIQPKERVKKVVYTPKPRPKGPPPIPPLVLKITAIAGEAPNFVAVIQYKGQDFIVEKGWKPDDKNFLVRNIYADKMEVFYSKDKSVKTFFF